MNKVLTEAKKKLLKKVQAGTAAAGDTNIATVAPKAGDTFGTAGATYEVSVSKNAVKDAAKEAVKVTSVSPCYYSNCRYICSSWKLLIRLVSMVISCNSNSIDIQTKRW